MSFLNPLGLLALLAIPAVLGLHFFRRRFQTRQVAGLFLFAPEGLAATAGRKRSQLLNTASLWLELAAALFLGLYLGGFCFGLTETAEHWIIVCDSSASMQAESGGQSTASRVQAHLEELFSGLSAETNITVIATGRRPQILAGPRAQIPEAEAALKLWSPGEQSHDVGPALHLGTEIAEKRGHLLFLTDTPDLATPKGYHYVALGTWLPNAAFAGARRLRKQNEDTIFVDLAGYADRSIEVEVTLSFDDEEGKTHVLQREDVELEKNAITSLRFSLPKTRFPITATLSDDALSLDNSVTLLPEAQKVVYAADLLPEKLSAALDLENVFATIPLIRETPSETADLLFTTTPSDGKRLLTEVVLQVPGEERDTWKGPYLTERSNPLMEGVFLQGVVWTAGREPLEGHPLVSAGNQALLAIETLTSGRRITLNLLPGGSNFTRSPAWPVFLYNLGELIRSELPGPADVNLEVGELIIFKRRKEMGDLSAIFLVDPAGKKRSARGSQILTWDADMPGIYTLTMNDKELARYSVFFLDQHESDLQNCGTKEAEAEEKALTDAKELAHGAGKTEGRLLALLLLLAVAADWFVLRATQAAGAGKRGGEA